LPLKSSPFGRSFWRFSKGRNDFLKAFLKIHPEYLLGKMTDPVTGLQYQCREQNKHAV
jgi:hypothetical protein